MQKSAVENLYSDSNIDEDTEHDEAKTERKEKAVKRGGTLTDHGKKKDFLKVTIDPYETPMMWWENQCVKYSISYRPVRYRLMELMQSHITRLTDRKYLSLLQSRIREDYERRQHIRIDERKMSPPSTITSFLETSREQIRRDILRNRA